MGTMPAMKEQEKLNGERNEKERKKTMLKEPVHLN